MTRGKKTFDQIAVEYVPYNTFPEFYLGAREYMDNFPDTPVTPRPYRGVQAQAYDRGQEAAMRFKQQLSAVR